MLSSLGYLIDRVFGIRLGAIIFAGFIAGGKRFIKMYMVRFWYVMNSVQHFPYSFAGQALTTLGVFLDNKIVVYVGRFVFGIGGENLAVACNTYSSSWFKGTFLNMAFGFQLAVVRVGSAVSLQIMGPIYEAFLPDQCELNETSTTVATTFITPTPGTPMTTTPMETTTVDNSYCDKEENKAMGYALTVAGASVILSLFGSMVAALLDWRKSKVLGNDLVEQPKV